MLKRIKFEDVKKAKLGQTFSSMEIMNSCKAVYGAVSWPGKRPGFAVVVAMDSTRHIDSYDISLLDEFESDRMRDLVRQCGVLDLKWTPERFIGDWKNEAADHFIREMNSEKKNQQHKEAGILTRQFSLTPTLMLEMDNLYQYILDELKKLLDEEHRQLILKEDSKILDYLSEIKSSKAADLQLGDYPAIEALAFAAIEMRNHFSRSRPMRSSYKEDCKYSDYDVLNV